MPTLLVYTRPTAGALFPLVPGLLEVRSRGVEVQVVTGAGYVEVLHEEGLAAAPIATVPVTEPGAGASSWAAIHQAEQVELRDHIRRCDPDAILVDAAAQGARAAAAGQAVPWALVDTGGGEPWAEGPAASEAHGPAAPRFTLASVDDLFASTLRAGPRLRVTGAAPWDPPRDEPQWLTAPGAPWVLVACSGGDEDSVAFARSTVAALRDQPLRVLVTIPHALEGAHLIPAPNVRVERFWPHRQVLARACALVCQGSPGPMTKALAAGVPIVIVPHTAEDAARAELLTKSGVAVAIPARKLRARRLQRALKEAFTFTDEAQAWALRHRKNLETSDPATRFADAVSELLDS